MNRPRRPRFKRKIDKAHKDDPKHILENIYK